MVIAALTGWLWSLACHNLTLSLVDSIFVSGTQFLNQQPSLIHVVRSEEIEFAFKSGDAAGIRQVDELFATDAVNSCSAAHCV